MTQNRAERGDTGDTGGSRYGGPPEWKEPQNGNQSLEFQFSFSHLGEALPLSVPLFPYLYKGRVRIHNC